MNPVVQSNKPNLWAPGIRYDKPIASGLVAYWPFWEGGGDKVHDASDFGRHGTMVTMEPETDWGYGPNGTILVFDGANDNVSIADSYTWLPHNEITIAARYRNDNQQQSALIAWNQGSFTNRIGVQAPWSNGEYYWDFGNSTGDGRLTGTWPGVEGEWGTIAVTSGPKGKNVYWNGVLINSNNTSSSITSATQPLLIGSALTTSQRMAGACDYIIMWKRALTYAEILELYHDPYGLITPKKQVRI